MASNTFDINLVVFKNYITNKQVQVRLDGIILHALDVVKSQSKN